MSRTRELVKWALLPFVLGAVVAFLTQPRPQTPAPDEPKRFAPAHPHDSRASAPQEVISVQEEETESPRCDELEQELSELEGLVEEWFGESPPWPEDSSNTQLFEPGFTTWMDHVALDVPGATVVEVDCSQYPCIGVWRVEGRNHAALAERVQVVEGLKYAMRMLPISDGQGNTSHWIVSASVYAPGTEDPALMSLRMNTALSANGWYEPAPPGGG